MSQTPNTRAPRHGLWTASLSRCALFSPGALLVAAACSSDGATVTSGGRPGSGGRASSANGATNGGAAANAGAASEPRGGSTTSAPSGGAQTETPNRGGDASNGGSTEDSNTTGGSAGGSAGSSGGSAGGSAGGGGDSAGSSTAGNGNAGNAGNAGSSSAGGGAAGSGGNAGSGGASTIEVPPGYQLVWHDEFDVEGAPNPANWKFERGFVRNEEAQWYQPDNASVQAGLLVIEARRERVENPQYTGQGDWKTARQYAEYTSSSLLTSGLQSWQYGRFEMRGRIPTQAGMWPAWWTLGVSGEWPSNGEIDIMEFYQGKLLANVACGTSTRYSAKWDSVTKQVSSLGDTWPSEFHTWRMDWDDQQIVLYVDDQELNTTTLQSMLNADGTSPFKQEAYMLLNLAIGGTNGGDPSNTPFPQRYEVDWVRVFQKQ